jgi:hypothetical protein
MERRTCWGIVMALAVGVACSSSQRSGKITAQLPEECEAYVGAYERCLAGQSPTTKHIAEARAAQTRSALQARLERAPDAVEPLRRDCARNVESLSRTCR